ncbi:MAG: hypothetical protein RSF40_09345 [Oscillospiraceae bacterium]
MKIQEYYYDIINDCNENKTSSKLNESLEDKEQQLSFLNIDEVKAI